MTRSIEFDYADRAWAIIPPPGDHDADARWMDAQVALVEGGPAAQALGDGALALARAAASAALDARRPEAVTSILFRPVDDLVFGLVHVVMLEGDADADQEWWRPGADLDGDPVVTRFSASSIPEGRRLAYVLADRFDDGERASAFSYAFETSGVRVLVYSEPATVDVTAVMMSACDRVVDSMAVAG